jgi:hypothetical protein
MNKPSVWISDDALVIYLCDHSDGNINGRPEIPVASVCSYMHSKIKVPKEQNHGILKKKSLVQKKSLDSNH